MARRFTGFLDTATGEPLPERFGACDRVENCGYLLTPYGPDPTDTAGLSFAQRARHEAHAGGIGAGQPRPPRRPTLPLPHALVPPNVLSGSLRYYERNALAAFLRGLLGCGVAADLLARFRVGTSAHWPGACVFWYIDERGQVWGGKIMLFDAAGHRVKTPYEHFTWLHKVLPKQYKKRGEALPAWLAAYLTRNGPKAPCLFGLPQLATAPPGKPVAIVESEKTAILATAALPAYVWLASGGLGNLTAERLAPVKGRRIMLFPDAGCLAAWEQRAAHLQMQGFTIGVSDSVERRAPCKGYDLGDLAVTEWQKLGYPPNWDAAE